MNVKWSSLQFATGASVTLTVSGAYPNTTATISGIQMPDMKSNSGFLQFEANPTTDAQGNLSSYFTANWQPGMNVMLLQVENIGPLPDDQFATNSSTANSPAATVAVTNNAIATPQASGTAGQSLPTTSSVVATTPITVIPVAAPASTTSTATTASSTGGSISWPLVAAAAAALYLVGKKG
jgi:hypothetical protein